MNLQDAQTLHDFSRRLGSTPRRLLIAAARMTDQSDPDVAGSLRRIRASGIQRNLLADQCARQLLTPVDSYARDSLGTAILALWQGSGQTD
ncbi:hypothetical protein [Dokdonella sp.]|uniref:hypothetical protein n=1 Tax=Dokdonella sp. TaxID=2291710 RepID=UPI003C3F8FB5